MLEDKNKFDELEHLLIQQGVVERFEKEHGKIKGRMMITLTDIPDDVEIKESDAKGLYAFRGTFDFYDSALNIALYTNPVEAASGIWIEPQTEQADTPAADWVDFFMKTLLTYIAEDGSFGVPMYSFVNDTMDFTVVPTSK